MQHIISRENVLGEFRTHIASQIGNVNKSLELVTNITDSSISTWFSIKLNGLVIDSTCNIDTAIEKYNSL